MTATIVSPQPRRPSTKPSAIPPLSPPLYISTDLPPRYASSALASPPRLLSPIHLADPLNYLSKSAVSCSPKRRRGHAATSTRASRRRHANRTDCAMNHASGPSMFDRLSWISHLQHAPQSVDIYDIADLSLLPIEQPPTLSPSHIGPVRSRKSSLRSDPMASVPAPAHQDRASRRSHSISLLPFPDREVLDPRTPPPCDKQLSDDIQFQDLLPALPVYDCRL